MGSQGPSTDWLVTKGNYPFQDLDWIRKEIGGDFENLNSKPPNRKPQTEDQSLPSVDRFVGSNGHCKVLLL